MLKNKTGMSVLLGIAMLISSGIPIAAEEIVYVSGNRRDPFIPLTAEETISVAATSSGVKLEGIIYDPGERSMAILNGKPYQTGESFGSAKVVKILKDHVVILIDGEEKTLWIRIEETR
jgi:type II secretory pathway component PulC